MKNQQLSLFEKGHFEPISKGFMLEGKEAFGGVAEFQRKYNKLDMDTLQNELHDSMVGDFLGFTLVNTDKHGLDCKLSEQDEVFLESKAASYSADSWGATFNDTTLEKADAFRDEKVWLALSVWTSTAELLFICYGQHESIGDYLEKGVLKHKAGDTVRSTQTIGLASLIKNYGFKVLAVGDTKENVYKAIVLKHNSLRKVLRIEDIQTLQDYEPPFMQATP